MCIIPTCIITTHAKPRQVASLLVIFVITHRTFIIKWYWLFSYKQFYHSDFVTALSYFTLHNFLAENLLHKFSLKATFLTFFINFRCSKPRTNAGNITELPVQKTRPSDLFRVSQKPRKKSKLPFGAGPSETRGMLSRLPTFNYIIILMADVIRLAFWLIVTRKTFCEK